MDASRSKRELRIAMKARRRQVSADERSAYSTMICGRLLERDDVRRAIVGKGVFAVYLASPDEIDLSCLVRRLWDSGCKVAVPAWRGGSYRLADLSRDTELAAGPMGILEPAADGGSAFRPVDEGCVSIWIVPGLAFSRSGARLGYGGGWYDRFLSRADPSSVSLGVAYPFQAVDEIPAEPHDRSLTDVVVDEEWMAVNDGLG